MKIPLNHLAINKDDIIDLEQWSNMMLTSKSISLHHSASRLNTDASLLRKSFVASNSRYRQKQARFLQSLICTLVSSSSVRAATATIETQVHSTTAATATTTTTTNQQQQQQQQQEQQQQNKTIRDSNNL